MVSTPETENDETSMGAICAWPCWLDEDPPDEDWPPWAGIAPAAPPCTWANFPCTFMTFMLMLPVTALTPSSAAICASFFVEIDCWPGAGHDRGAVELLALPGLVRRLHAEALRTALVHLLLLRHGDVGADAVERLEHLVLRLAHAVGVRGHGDHERHADGEAEGGEQRLAMPPAQLPEHVGEEHAASLSAAGGAGGLRRPPPGFLSAGCTTPAWEAAEARLRAC